MPPLSVIAILAIAVVMIGVVCRVDGVALFAPKSTKRIKGAAQRYCLDQCRTADGHCPLALEPSDCPLWQFVKADLQTDTRIDPFRPVSGVWSELKSAGRAGRAARAN